MVGAWKGGLLSTKEGQSHDWPGALSVLGFSRGPSTWDNVYGCQISDPELKGLFHVVSLPSPRACTLLAPKCL